ncbi:MAG: protein of unknown function DUF4326 [Edafosvirus sp.]|uniref:DUF4326 domain-containing protein n=1 Tax=Edafosvirus sp. TaxID=2487765 RepID=A0A3G4ZV24_9VIRU|nr:MAG: protein of unknown function DUF4326 [Edafosvirus sp.]
MSKVINISVKELRKKNYNNLLEWLDASKKHIYIGRDMSFYIKGATQSKWHNPFNVKKYGREECLKLYEKYLRNNKELMNDIKELDGCILGCWCAPLSCHGDILMKVLNEK